MSRAGVNGIVTGEENPSAPTVRLFETVLRADLPDVLRETPPPYGTDAAKLVAELESLDPKVRPEVIQGVRQIIKAYHKPRRKPPSGSHKPT